MDGTRHRNLPASEICNIRFLVEQQFRTIDEIERGGLEARAARELLSRLMRRHEDIKGRAAAEPLRAA